MAKKSRRRRKPKKFQRHSAFESRFKLESDYKKYNNSKRLKRRYGGFYARNEHVEVHRGYDTRKAPKGRRRNPVRVEDSAVQRSIRDRSAFNNQRRIERQSYLRSENTRRICRGRMDRRNALFALRIAGRGRGGPKKRVLTEKSKVRC